jgi:hypothetical protein
MRGVNGTGNNLCCVLLLQHFFNASFLHDGLHNPLVGLSRVLRQRLWHVCPLMGLAMSRVSRVSGISCVSSVSSVRGVSRASSVGSVRGVSCASSVSSENGVSPC